MKPLTPEERRVILQKGTERPFSGIYNDCWSEGVYHCRRCGAALYRSADKFDAGCGWPSFDDEIAGAVGRVPDADGRRTEIVCARCGGHLGHVFTGEGFTPKQTRHCVNSVSLLFEPATGGSNASSGLPDPAERAPNSLGGTPSLADEDPGSGSGDPNAMSEDPNAMSEDPIPPAAGAPAVETAYFAGGCFWGVEYMLSKLAGVLDVESGYMGGKIEAPTYEEVCRGDTEYAETVRVRFDPSKVSYETLAKFFFEIHDPTQQDGQGPDIGNQYRSEIFYTSPLQRTIAERLIARLRARGYSVATELTPAGRFWPAEAYHQDYYERKGTLPYCHVYTKRF